MEELDNEQASEVESVSVSLNRYGSGMSYRISINGAKNFDDAIAKVMAAKAKLVDELQKSGEKIIAQSEYKRY